MSINILDDSSGLSFRAFSVRADRDSPFYQSQGMKPFARGVNQK